jgi:putative heme-binding domain-containing protein
MLSSHFSFFNDRPQLKFAVVGLLVLGAYAPFLCVGLSLEDRSKIPPEVSLADPRTAEEERKGFHLPPGFEIELVAAEPQVRKPININFDDRGRLWVTESVEYPFPAKDRPGRDVVGVMENIRPEGKAEKVFNFAGGLNIPIGVLPMSEGAIVYSIPNIYRLHDTQGKDRCDRREVLLGTIGYQDTHGMTGEFVWGFDGWIYACHGYANTSTLKASDGSSITMNSGNTYRFKPDGSRVEQFTHGQVNPFGLAFSPLGDLFSCDCHTRPIMLLLRGAYYDSFGKPHDGLGYSPEIMTHDHGSTAIAGITYYAADHFPPEYQGTVFVGNVVTNRINHDRLAWHGSSPTAVELKDFVISDDPWFRPVDIKLGPDGALYVADFYNRIIGHYEVPLDHPGRDRERGRIWRIIYRGPDGKGPPPRMPRADWGKASVDELVKDLAHPNLVVRMKAANQLVERGGEAAVRKIKARMQEGASPLQLVHGLWVLERMKALDDRLLETTATDGHKEVRVHAMRILAERSPLTDFQHQLVLGGLGDPDPFVQRAAADALGTHPATANIAPLLALRHKVSADDPHLMHEVRMALRNQLRKASDWAELPSPLSEQDARAIADIAPGIHSTEAARFLLHHLETHTETFDNQLRYLHHVARFGKAGTGDKLLPIARKDQTAPLDQQLALFKAIQEGTQARGEPLTRVGRQWGEDLAAKLLNAQDENQVVAGVELCGSLRIATLQGDLVALAQEKKASERRREAAMAALAAIDPKKHTYLLGQILSDSTDPIGLREKAAGILGGINQPQAQEELLKALLSAPERLALAIAIGLAGSRTGAEKLLEAVTNGKASARLLQERPVEFRLAGTQLPGWKERVAKLTRGLPPADQRVQSLMKARHDGFLATKTDPALGMKVYEKNCGICHQLANKGAKIGPQLDGIGNRGLDRLLEDIIDPNRNVDQAFRATTLTLTNGQLVTGLVLREEGEVVVVADAQGKEVRVPKKMIEERNVSQLSPMPANLVEQIPEADFYNLMAYLLEQRPPKEIKNRDPTR